jgi:exopolysaccharide production protein ExoQ
MNYAPARRVPLAGIRSSASYRPGGASLRPPAVNLVWCCCAASVTCILLGNLVGAIGAYMFLALWGLFAITRMRASLRALVFDPGIWLFPAFALASCIWSYHHMISLRFGLQFAATVGCAAIAARLLSPRQLIGALLVSLTAIAVLCVAIGRSNFNQLTQTVDFVGIFKTKNELAFLISLLLLAAATTLFDSASRPTMRLLAAVSVAPAVPLLIRAHSATSLVTTVIALAALFGNVAIARLQPRERARVLLMCAVILLPLLALAGLASGAAQDFIVHVLGRSGTMTGRTVLWQRALELIPQHSVLGWGWQAFWVQNSADAEGLWAKFHIAGRQGFQFQNTFLETAIELGWVGCALLVVAMFTTLHRALRWSWRERSLVSSFHVALMLCLLIRAMVEVDILYQFSIGAFVFFVTMRQASDRGRRWPRRAGRFIGGHHRVGPPHSAGVARHAPS